MTFGILFTLLAGIVIAVIVLAAYIWQQWQIKRKVEKYERLLKKGL